MSGIAITTQTDKRITTDKRPTSETSTVKDEKRNCLILQFFRAHHRAMIIYANAHKDGVDHIHPFGLFYSGTRRPECVEICGRDAVACTQQEKEKTK